MNALGQIGGFLLPFVFIRIKHNNYGEIRSEIYVYLMMHTIVAAVCFILTFFFFHENKAPNLEAQADKAESKEVSIPMGTQIKCLFTDKCYVQMFVSASITFGLLGALGNAVSLVVSVWGYDEVRFNFEVKKLIF
jgi:Na+/melibiose symporter-like transporter